MTDQGTQLHDHGGGLRESIRGADDTVAFGDRYVHDVRNLNAETAVSVHAYSPPLSLMNYYDLEGDRLIKLASVWTEDPEEPALAQALNEAL